MSSFRQNRTLEDAAKWGKRGENLKNRNRVGQTEISHCAKWPAVAEHTGCLGEWQPVQWLVLQHGYVTLCSPGVLGFNCAVHLTGIYSQAVQAVRLVAIRLSRSPIIMTHFVAVAQRTANSRSSLPILDDASRVPRPTFHVRRPTHPAAGCSIFACLLFRLRHFDFLICLVAFCIHLPLHFICQHCITLSGISSGYPRPRPSPAPFFTPALAALLTIAAPATARQNYLLGKIKSFALLCGAEGVGWNGRVSQTRESLKLCQGHSAPTCTETLSPAPLRPTHGGKFEKLLRKRKTAPQTLFNFQCPPLLHFRLLQKLLTPTRATTPTHTYTQTLTHKLPMAFDKSLSLADRLIDRRTCLKVLRLFAKPQQLK